MAMQESEIFNLDNEPPTQEYLDQTARPLTPDFLDEWCLWGGRFIFTICSDLRIYLRTRIR